MTQDNNTIIREGKTYKYHPDSDCYYREYTRKELGHWGTYDWIYVMIILTAVAYYVSN
jgi:hypothetical protein